MTIPKVKRLVGPDGAQSGWTFDCPGCEQKHVIGMGWQFNGDVNAPTFSPSILVDGFGADSKPIRCHSFITNGDIQFCTDCNHDLAGKTVSL